MFKLMLRTDYDKRVRAQARAMGAEWAPSQAGSWASIWQEFPEIACEIFAKHSIYTYVLFIY